MNEANSQRKQEQLQISLGRDINSAALVSGLDDYYFVHQALPEVDLARVDLSISLFGKSLSAPLFISPMVGGIEDAAIINRNLAQAAQILGIAMGVGSQRRGIDNPAVAFTYGVRNAAPDILLFANLGAVQLNYGYGVAECQRAVEMIDADGLILHLNPLQEALQRDGNSNFAGLLPKIEKVCREVGVPVVIKEVGYGISEGVARKLAEVGVAGIDVAGAGGTSWSEVEKHRARTEPNSNIASTFANWGIPTAESIRMVRSGAPQLVVIGSGGIRNGLDIAKCIALGANAVGIGGPLLKAANVSVETVMKVLNELVETLRISMFCIGAANLEQLKGTQLLEKKAKQY